MSDVREVIAPYALCSCPTEGEEPHDPECAHYFLLGAVHDALVDARRRLEDRAVRWDNGLIALHDVQDTLTDMVEQVDALSHSTTEQPVSKDTEPMPVAMRSAPCSACGALLYHSEDCPISASEQPFDDTGDDR